MKFYYFFDPEDSAANSHHSSIILNQSIEIRLNCCNQNQNAESTVTPTSNEKSKVSSPSACTTIQLCGTPNSATETKSEENDTRIQLTINPEFGALFDLLIEQQKRLNEESAALEKVLLDLKTKHFGKKYIISQQK